MGIYITILEQGLIYGILALGVYITYKILDFPDLTVDGSFPLGAALTATMITRGVHPILTLPASFLIGVLAGDYGFTIVDKGIAQTADISLATDELLTEVDCLTNLTDNTVVASLATILDKANKQNIPVFGSEIEQVKIGCLAAEGLDYVALGKQTGKMAAEILKGEKKASEMNFETITEPGFYVNEKVAENLGVTVPQDLADEAVESFTEITK